MTLKMNDPFKIKYKKYRQIECGQFQQLNNDSDLIDLNNLNQCESLIEQIDFVNLNKRDLFKMERFCRFKNAFKHLDEWRFYKIRNGPDGLILIPNVFKDDFSVELFNQLLYEIPNKYYSQLKSNLIKLPIDQDNLLESKLRWITFGHHYDWTNKIYFRNDFNKMPSLLDDLLSYLKELLNLDLKLEAGIVNYYTCKSKLNPHSDCREENLIPPLLSLSLGAKSIFLIGGKNRFDTPVYPIVLRNGDLMIMSNESRLSYHSVVKIVCDKKCKRKAITRINVNVRQVY